MAAEDDEFEEQIDEAVDAPDDLEDDNLEDEDVALDDDFAGDGVLLDAEVEVEEDAVIEEPLPPPAPTTDEEEGEDDEEEADPDDVEADLDTILKDRLVVAEDEEDEDEDEVPDPDEKGEATKVRPKAPGEFVCQSCFLVKHPSQLADPVRQLCRDCV